MPDPTPKLTAEEIAMGLAEMLDGKGMLSPSVEKLQVADALLSFIRALAKEQVERRSDHPNRRKPRPYSGGSAAEDFGCD